MRGIRHVWQAREELCCMGEGVAPLLRPEIAGVHGAPLAHEKASL